MSSKMARIDKEFERRLRAISKERLIEGTDLDLKQRSLPELTAMSLNCPSFKKLGDELTRLKRKGDLR